MQLSTLEMHGVKKFLSPPKLDLAYSLVKSCLSCNIALVIITVDCQDAS